MFGGFRRVASWAVVAIVLIAVWRLNNGDMNTFVDNVWNFLNKGADVAISLWNSIQHVGHTVQSSAVVAPVAAPAS